MSRAKVAATQSMKRKSDKCAQWTAECAFDAPAARRMCTRPAKRHKAQAQTWKQMFQQRRSARYTTISAITGRVIRENTVVKKVPRDMVRVSPS